jgi:protein tyrosine kinase modulator
VTIQDVFRIVLRRWWLALLVAVIGAALGYAYESSKPERFTAAARVLIGPSLEEGANALESTGALTRSTLQQTLAELITGSEVRRMATGRIDGLDQRSIQITSAVVPEANVVRLQVEGPDPELVVELGEAVVEESERTFESRYPFYDVSLLDAPTTPTSPTSPNPELGAVIGAVLGAMALTIVLLFADQRDARAEPRRISWPRRPDPPVPALRNYQNGSDSRSGPQTGAHDGPDRRATVPQPGRSVEPTAEPGPEPEPEPDPTEPPGDLGPDFDESVPLAPTALDRAEFDRAEIVGDVEADIDVPGIDDTEVEVDQAPVGADRAEDLDDPSDGPAADHGNSQVRRDQDAHPPEDWAAILTDAWLEVMTRPDAGPASSLLGETTGGGRPNGRPRADDDTDVIGRSGPAEG